MMVQASIESTKKLSLHQEYL